MSNKQTKFSRDRAVNIPGLGIMQAMGPTVPTDAETGYGFGCIFQHTDGGAGTALYINVGSKTSCNFDPIDGTNTAITDAYANYAGETIETALAEIGGRAYCNRFTINVDLAGTVAAEYGTIFIAPKACKVISMREVHGTAAGQAANVQVERAQGTEANGAGDDLLTNDTDAGFELDATAVTVQEGGLTSTTAHLTLAAGDRLNLIDSGTLTTLADVCITIEMEWVVEDNS